MNYLIYIYLKFNYIYNKIRWQKETNQQAGNLQRELQYLEGQSKKVCVLTFEKVCVLTFEKVRVLTFEKV